jgi:hypothetical protein
VQGKALGYHQTSTLYAGLPGGALSPEAKPNLGSIPSQAWFNPSPWKARLSDGFVTCGRNSTAVECLHTLCGIAVPQDSPLDYGGTDHRRTLWKAGHMYK